MPVRIAGNVVCLLLAIVAIISFAASFLFEAKSIFTEAKLPFILFFLISTIFNSDF